MRYAVVGAGVLGLTVALRLAQQGHEVVVVERDVVVGGLSASFEVAPGASLERFYHHIFRSDRCAIALIREMGLGDRLRWHRPESTVLVGGVPHRLDSPISLLQFAPASLWSRLRMGAAMGLLRVLPSPRPLESSRADAWMRRAVGNAGHELVWGPLLRAKFGTAASEVSMAWLWARIHDRTTDLGYLDGGFAALYEGLAAAVEREGGSVLLGADATGLTRLEDGIRVDWSAVQDGVERHATFDRVISTASPATTARLAGIRGDSARAADGVAAFPPLSALCLILALDRPLTGIYWIGVPASAGPFLAVVEHTAMLPPAAYGGQHLIYLGAYRDASDPLPGLALNQQIAAASDLLMTLNPAFDPSWITGAWSFVAPEAQPIVDTGYRHRIPGFETGIAGLYNASLFHVYPHDRGQNYSIDLAERLITTLDKGEAR